MNRIDHIVVAAQTLQQGVDYIRATLGVDIPKGGLHQTMGTHNHLMQLGQDAYLEVIAINPDAEKPVRPRWFGLDDHLMRTSLSQQPRLITWVMNTPDIHQLAQHAALSIGTPTKLSRNNLSWQIGLTEDGRLIGSGLLPYAIQWHSTPHPSGSMADLGCRLESLDIYHNRSDWLSHILASLDASHLVKLHELDDDGTPYLSATIKTHSGIKTLSSLTSPVA